MLKTLLLASLVALPAAAQPAPPTPPGPPPPGFAPAVCRAKGDVLLDIDLGAPNTHAFNTWSVALHENGAVIRRDFDKDGKLTSMVGPACLSNAQLDAIKKELAASKFTIKHAEIACAAISATWVDYSVGGKLVFSEHMCGHDYLDDASAKALHDASDILMKVTAPDPITTSRGKPVK